ncbi:MAG: hypothetical protein AAB400_03990, partial [Patescibacteria group bacterium]
LNDALIPFSTRAQHPLTCEAWKKAYEGIAKILHDGNIADDRIFDLWYCVMEAGLVDFNKMSFTKDVAVRLTEECEAVFDVITQHPCGEWVSLMFDEVAFVFRGEMPYAETVRKRFDCSRLVRLLEEAVINLNILTTCYEYIQQRKEGVVDSEMKPTSFSIPGLSLLFYQQDSEDDFAYQAKIVERIAHGVALQVG